MYLRWRTYARNGMDAHHVRVGDFVCPMATRLRAGLPIPTTFGTMWSISDRFAPDVARDVYQELFHSQIMEMLHEHCTELLGVLDTTERRSQLTACGLYTNYGSIGVLHAHRSINLFSVLYFRPSSTISLDCCQLQLSCGCGCPSWSGTSN